MPKSTRLFNKRLFIKGIIFSLLLLSAFFFVAGRYKEANFGDAQIDEILFYIINGASEGQAASLIEAVKDNLILIGIISFILLVPVIDFYRNRIIINVDLSWIGKKKRKAINPSQIPIGYKLSYSILIFLISTIMLLNTFGVFGYLRSLTEKSTLFEDHFVDPQTVKLDFPEKKKNLIYIYLESMENTVASSRNGGKADRSRIPELENIALDEQNTSFSNLSSGLGGALPATGTTWTVGGIVAQSSGLPLKTSILGQDHNQMGLYKQFLPGATTLGDILKKEGYSQSFVMGSESAFGGRDKLLVQHGEFNIIDLSKAKEMQYIDSNYHTWWGYEDKKLFEYAKEEASRLGQINKPFNLSLLTADTHFTDGYLDPSCPTDFKGKYDNVYACSSKQVADFIDWVKDQPFADDTVIVISGDHLGMQTSYYDDLIAGADYSRTIFNIFLGSSAKAHNTHSRLFTAFDMFPSTLAAMGVNIEGNRLGLGTNLFSDKPSLLEELGSLNALNDELSKRSDYYENRIFRAQD